MNSSDDDFFGQNKPVAYDADGNPLYAEPPKAPRSSSETLNFNGSKEPPRYVHLTRAVEPEAPKISPTIKRRHDESVAAFPGLNISENEYIISVVRRHPIGMLPAILVSCLMISLALIALFNFDYLMELLQLPETAHTSFLMLCIALMVASGVGGYVSIWVYTHNMFFLTNESVIQEIQNSIFSRTEQTVSLLNIEDASFNQRGIMQTLFNYGSIRLSTEGDETTYRFSYVANPKREIAVLNNAVEAFKNGRPVHDEEDDRRQKASDPGGWY